MKETLGRNDPCYCGSGKKYKNCHLKPFYPTEHFSCKISGFDTIKFENRLPQQYFEVGRVDVYYSSQTPWDSEIAALLKPFIEVDLNKNDRWENRVKKRLEKLHHKLDAIKYHIESFKSYERNVETELRNHVVANTTKNKIYDDPLLIYNFESFLFQSKSCLDVLSQLLAYCFKEKITTFGNHGNDLINLLQKKSKKDNSKEKRSMIDVIQGSRNWVKDLVEMRDEVTHFSDLEGFSCFLIMQSSEIDQYARVYYPSIPSGERVSKYMDRTWNNICCLISQTAQTPIDYLRPK